MPPFPSHLPPFRARAKFSTSERIDLSTSNCCKVPFLQESDRGGSTRLQGIIHAALCASQFIPFVPPVASRNTLDESPNARRRGWVTLLFHIRLQVVAVAASYHYRPVARVTSRLFGKGRKSRSYTFLTCPSVSQEFFRKNVSLIRAYDTTLIALLTRARSSFIFHPTTHGARSNGFMLYFFPAHPDFFICPTYTERRTDMPLYYD